MGKYYYVNMVNPRGYSNKDGGYSESETWKLAKNCVTSLSIEYSGPSGLALLNVKKAITQEYKKILGFNYTNDVVVYQPVFMICEDLGNCLEDVITGRTYECTKEYSHPLSNRLILRKECELSSGKVITLLDELSREDINRYRLASQNLNHAISVGYKNDIARMAQQEVQEKNNDEYIRSFKRRYDR